MSFYKDRLDLEFASDILLSENGFLAHGSGIYSSVSFEQKLRRESAKSVSIDSMNVSDIRQRGMRELRMTLMRNELVKMLENADLAYVKKLYFEMYIYGVSMKSIGRVFGVSASYVSRCISDTADELTDMYISGGYFDWFEVYISEICR